MNGIVFKQRFISKSSPKAVGSNAAHLAYIATRPGTVPNPGCGFGLWGQMEANQTAANINNLETAQAALREASQRHTIYRAVISVGAEDAANHGLYDRAKWEQLTRAHIHSISDRMGIENADLRWMVSFHQKKGHPHIHIMYWDAGDQPRNEFMPPGRFEKISEQIRADWNKDIFADEITDARSAQQDDLKELRDTLREICIDTNPYSAIDREALLKSPVMVPLSTQMVDMLNSIPLNGSLRYKYLPPECKKQVERFIDLALELPELKKLLNRFLDATDSISDQFGNGKQTAERNRQAAIEKLRSGMANTVMDAIKSIRAEQMPNRTEKRPSQHLSRKELQQQINSWNEQHREQMEDLAETIAADWGITVDMIRSMQKYDSAKALMPARRTSNTELMQIDGFREAVNDLMRDLTAHNIKLKNYLNMKIEGLHDSKAMKETLREATKDIRDLVLLALREDAGYTQWSLWEAAFNSQREAAFSSQSEQINAAASIIQELFRLLCQSHGQAETRQRQITHQHKRWLNMSREERMHRRAKRAQRGTQVPETE